jgi:hypothetical protein
MPPPPPIPNKRRESNSDLRMLRGPAEISRDGRSGRDAGSVCGPRGRPATHSGVRLRSFGSYADSVRGPRSTINVDSERQSLVKAPESECSVGRPAASRTTAVAASHDETNWCLSKSIRERHTAPELADGGTRKMTRV